METNEFGENVAVTIYGDSVARLLDRAPSVSPVQPMTKLDVLRRITPAEWAAFQASVIPEVMYFRACFEATAEIRSDDPLTQSGLAALVAVGILATGRPAEILA